MEDLIKRKKENNILINGFLVFSSETFPILINVSKKKCDILVLVLFKRKLVACVEK